jgi:hypothetical protein
MVTDKRPPVEKNQIVGYNKVQDQYVLRSAGETSYVDFRKLFLKLSNGENIFVEEVKDSISGFSNTFQDNEDMLIKEDNAMYVEHIMNSRRNSTPFIDQLNYQASYILYMKIS